MTDDVLSLARTTGLSGDADGVPPIPAGAPTSDEWLLNAPTRDDLVSGHQLGLLGAAATRQQLRGPHDRGRSRCGRAARRPSWADRS